MTKPMLDVLTYTKDLEEAGFNRTQAEAIARGNFALLEPRLDNLVTRDHFDLKVDELDRRIARIEKTLDPIKTQVNLLTWMMGLVVLVLVVPQLQSWFAVG